MRSNHKYTPYGKMVENTCYIPRIKKVIFNEPATIVFWDDDTKTVVKSSGNDIFDPEKGLAMAIAKKAMGRNYSRIRKEVKKYCSDGNKLAEEWADILTSAQVYPKAVEDAKWPE